LSLFEAFTLPALCYGCEGLHFTNKVLNKFNVCWNNVYRIVFGFTNGSLLKVSSGIVRGLITIADVDVLLVASSVMLFYSAEPVYHDCRPMKPIRVSLLLFYINLK